MVREQHPQPAPENNQPMENNYQPDDLSLAYMEYLQSSYPQLSEEQIAEMTATHLANPLFRETVERVKNLEEKTGENQSSRGWFRSHKEQK